jgi:hypothetical protein
MRRLSCIVTIVVVFAAVSTSAQDRVITIAALTPIAEHAATWSAGGGRHTIELRNFRPGADPVVHIIAPDGAERARGVAAGNRVSVTTTSSEAGSYIIVVRSRSSPAVETGDLWIDGQLVQRGLRFSSGTRIPMNDLAAGEEIVAITPPNGARTHSAFLLSASDDTIIQRTGGNRTLLRLRSGNRSSVVALYAAPDSAAGAIRVYRNDVGTDSDGDGLGDALETALGTCASSNGSVAGVECRDIADPRDTDGDGLWDSWEVLGYDASWTEGTATVRRHLPLPTWGADPRHKDIFIEVDFRRLDWEENQSQRTERMTPAVARSLAGMYGDAATTNGALRLLHAVSAGNPDARPGISLHFDIGVEPESPDDATIYGDWGGYTAVDAIQDANGNWVPQTPAGAYPAAMSPARRGIFHYVLGYTTGGGSCGQGIACGFNFRSANNAAHEFGHTFGLDHNGPGGTHEPNCKPNYPSLMNYAYYDVGWMQFSDGRSLGVLNNHALVETGAVDPGNAALLQTLGSVFRYKVDPATGSVDWNRDNQFAPPGTTVRAYANFRPGTSCEFTRERQVASGLKSQQSPAIVRYRDHLWIFAVTLDGQLSYTYTAPPFRCPSIDDCPDPRFVSPGTREIGPIAGIDAAVITVNNRQMILIVGTRPDGSLFESWVEESGGRFIWGSTQAIAGSSPAAGEPSLAATSDGRAVVLAYRSRDNVVRYRFRSAAAFGAEQTVRVAGNPLVMSANASPTMAYTGLSVDPIAARPEQLIGAFTNAAGELHLYAPDRLGRTWTRIGIPYDAMRAVTGRPAIAWVGPLPGATVATAESGSAPSSRPRAASDASRPPRRDAPPLAGAPHLATTATPLTIGRFYVLYVAKGNVPGHPRPDAVRMAMSYVDASGKMRIGLDSLFDNDWSYAFGIDLLQPGEVALRAAETYAITRDVFNQVWMRPHADGISDLPYRNYDDWKVLAWGTCSVLAHHQIDPRKTKCAAPGW